MYNDNHTDEYYLLENRQQVSWDKYVPSAGLLILHVDYDEDIWYWNAVNTTSGDYCYGNNHQRLTWVAADGTQTSGYARDTYPYGTVNAFGNRTSPAATLYNKNTDGSKYLNKQITEITQNDDSTISFVFDLDSSMVEPPIVVEGDTLFYESFNDCNGYGGNDDVWNSVVNSENKNYYPDYSSWDMTYVRGCDQCVLLGSGKKTGTATTPSIVLDGEYTLMFKAAPWSSESATLDVYVKSGEATLSTSSFSLTNNQWNNCSLTISGNDAVTLAIKASKNRFFLDEVLIIKTESTGISEVKPSQIKRDNQRIYSIDGRYVGTDLNKLSHGIYIVNGKKVIR